MLVIWKGALGRGKEREGGDGKRLGEGWKKGRKGKGKRMDEERGGKKGKGKGGLEREEGIGEEKTMG